MVFNPFNIGPVGRWIANWLAGPEAEDPFAALAQYFRAQAAYHRSIMDESGAVLCEGHADLVESCVAAIREAEVEYDDAAAISTWERGTIKNKKAEMDEAYGPASRGKVKVRALPLKALPYTGLHAVRAVDQLQAVKETKSQRARHMTRDEVADDEWANAAMRAAGKRGR